MINLLNAGFTRLRKSILFWILIVTMIGIACFFVLQEYNDVVKHGEVVSTEQVMFLFSPFIGIVIAVFVSFYIGVEYSDGTIRNKVVVGHKRTNIYLSSVVINTVASIIIYLVYLSVVAMLGIPLLGGIKMGFSSFVLQLFVIIMTIVVYSSILTFIALLCSNKTITAVVTILTILVLLIVCANLIDLLTAPETILNGFLNPETNQIEYVREPNPAYPSELLKKIYKTILDIMPTGQEIEIVAGLETNYAILPLYSLGLIIIFNGIGLYLFNKKDLK